jgi:hypothetical protein
MGVKNELFPLKCIWLLLHCLALPRWQVINVKRTYLYKHNVKDDQIIGYTKNGKYQIC